MKPPSMESAVRYLLVNEERGDTLIPEALYVAPVSWKPELAAILKGVDTDHILSMQKEETSLAWTLPFMQQATTTGDVGKRWCINGGNEDNWAVEIHAASAGKKLGIQVKMKYLKSKRTSRKIQY